MIPIHFDLRHRFNMPQILREFEFRAKVTALVLAILGVIKLFMKIVAINSTFPPPPAYIGLPSAFLIGATPPLLVVIIIKIIDVIYEYRGPRH